MLTSNESHRDHLQMLLELRPQALQRSSHIGLPQLQKLKYHQARCALSTSRILRKPTVPFSQRQ